MPDVPVIVTVDDPAAAVLPADSVMTPLLLNEAVTPLGRPDAASATLPVNPFFGVTVIELVPLLPCESARVLGDAERLKSGNAAAFTVSATVVV